MIKLKSSTGKVHIKQRGNGTLCNGWFRLMYPTATKTNAPVTCKSCLNILNRNNPNREESLMLAESFLPDSKEPINTKICFGSKVNSVQTFFKTKAEKYAYIKGVKDALLKIRASYVTINGERI
jgi:hypothetical protein